MESFIGNTVSSANRDTWTDCLTCIPSLFLLSCLLLQHNLRKEYCNGQHCLIVPSSVQLLQVLLSFRMLLAVGFSYVAFIVWGNAPSTLLPRTFIMKACWVLSKVFLLLLSFKSIYVEPFPTSQG